MNRRWLQPGLWITAAALNAAAVAWLAWVLAAPVSVALTADALEPPPMSATAPPSGGVFPELAAYRPIWGEAEEPPPPTEAQPLADGALQLMATVLEAGHTYAVFLHEPDRRIVVCREGETVNDITVSRIEAERVHIQRDGQPFVLQLPKDAGEGAGL